MGSDVPTQTPPSQPALADECLGRSVGTPAPRCEIGSKARPLFTAADQRQDLLQAYPELSDLCDRLGFGEGVSLGEWCESPEWALLELARAAFPPPPRPSCDLSSSDLSQIVADLIDGHHRPLRNEVQRLAILISNWRMQDPEPVYVEAVERFQEFTERLIAHLDHEETVIFPQCLVIDGASRLPRGSALPIREMTSTIREMNVGHEEAERSLEHICQFFGRLALDHIPDLRVIRIGLADMAADLVIHETKELDFLGPAALHAEGQVRALHGLP